MSAHVELCICLYVLQWATGGQTPCGTVEYRTSVGHCIWGWAYPQLSTGQTGLISWDIKPAVGICGCRLSIRHLLREKKDGFQNVQNILGKIYIQTILAVFDPRVSRIACGMLKAFIIRPWCPCSLVRRALIFFYSEMLVRVHIFKERLRLATSLDVLLLTLKINVLSEASKQYSYPNLWTSLGILIGTVSANSLYRYQNISWMYFIFVNRGSVWPLNVKTKIIHSCETY